MKPNRQKSGECSPSISKEQLRDLSTNSEVESSIQDRVNLSVVSKNPVIHQCPMIRDKPLSKGEVNIQLKKQWVKLE